MRMRKYVVREMPEAIAQIRRDLGPDAVILSTRPVTRRTRWGFRRERWLEVTAAVGPDLPGLAGGLAGSTADERQSAPDLRQLQKDVERLRQFLESLSERDSVDTARERAGEPAWVQRVHAEEWGYGMSFHPSLGLRVDTHAAPGERAYRGGTATATVSGFDVEAAVREVLARVPQPEPGIGETARVIAFVGPTGVGKTTTIAKIAALQVLSGHRRVGFVSVDTFRIAAVDQLRTYADILGIPMAVAERPEDARHALAQVSACDLVLVDTTGRSYVRSEHTADTERWLSALGVDEVHLVLSMTAKPTDLVRVARALEDIGYHKYLFTKLDETSNLGGVAHLLWTLPRPVSYVTTGQNVPDDIEVADVEALVREALSGIARAGA